MLIKMASEDNEEDIWDSWEEMAESGELERRMEEREREHMMIRDEIDKKLFEPGVRVLVESESSRTQYIPQVRILRRDRNNIAEDNLAADNANKKIHKTLAQREAEYASARARILGETEESNSEEPGKQLSNSTMVEKCPDNIIRQPRGPDGSEGFALQR